MVMKLHTGVMLLRFRVANHRSIRDEQELSLVAVPRKGEPQASGSIPPTVRVTGIYGANASGKSNVLDAMDFMVKAVRSSYRDWSPTGGVERNPFLLDDTSRKAVSRYEIDLVVDGVHYAYGFEVDDHRVRAEWLKAFGSGSRARLLFSRKVDDFTFGRSLSGPRTAVEKLTRSNALFLSVAVANAYPLLRDIYAALVDGIHPPLHSHYLSNPPVGHIAGERLRPRVEKLVKFADLGIEELLVHRQDEQSGSPRRSVELKLKHSADAEVLFSLSEESAGTVAWLSAMVPVLEVLDSGGVLLVDEVDSSLHPMLSAAFIQMFKDPVINAKAAQLVFTSHDVALLGTLLRDDLLGRDEVWFTEKDQSGTTTLFPLTDFKPRTGENFERAYLQGRYGAVPYIDLTELRSMFAATSED